MRTCKNFMDFHTGDISRKVIGALMSFYAVSGLPGVWVCVRVCREDTTPGPGQVVAIRERQTGVLSGYYLLERLDKISDAVTTGSW